ncbi:hypothetical protein [Coleofasciculus sp.]|uniref:hypothetical protein n=1 Tax=Coleofasciculus sp. TaxID=3100458 RepID=UPI003A4292AB
MFWGGECDRATVQNKMLLMPKAMVRLWGGFGCNPERVCDRKSSLIGSEGMPSESKVVPVTLFAYHRSNPYWMRLKPKCSTSALGKLQFKVRSRYHRYSTQAFWS